MQLSELLLDRYLYKNSKQSLETQDSVSTSMDSMPVEPTPIPSGGSAQDINTSNVFINGGIIEPGTIPADVLDVSNWGWGQTCVFTSTDLDTVSWGAGVFTSANGVSYNISAGNTGNMSAKNYIYLDLNVSEIEYQITTTSATSVGIGKVLIAVAEDGTDDATYNLSQASQIVADNILANTIDASKMNVGQLSAITADFGNMTAGTITGVTITGGTIQTATTGKRLRMMGSPANQYQFLDGASKVGHIEIDDDGAGGYFAEIFIDHLSAGMSVGSTVGASEIVYFSAPFFSSAGRSAVGQAAIESNGPITGLVWSGGNPATWSFNLGSAIAKISSDTLPSATGTYDLGSSTFRWQELHANSITLSGTTRTSWPTSGATTALDNLASVAINTSLISDTNNTDDLGSSSVHWRNTYTGNVFLLNGEGDIYYNSNIALQFFASRIELGSGYDEFAPDSLLSANLGSSTRRWNTGFFDTIDMNGAIDMNGNDITAGADISCDGLRLSSGSAHSPSVEGEITFYDSGTIQYRGRIVSTNYSFDLTAV